MITTYRTLGINNSTDVMDNKCGSRSNMERPPMHGMHMLIHTICVIQYNNRHRVRARDVCH